VTAGPFDSEGHPIRAVEAPGGGALATEATLAAKLGEVQDSPTTYTVLARLKALLTDTQLRATAVPVLPSAQELHLGEIGGNSDPVEVTLSLDTNAYHANDVLAATQEVAAAVRVNAGKALLTSIILNDKDDQKVALDLVLLRTNVALGTENAAPSIADNDADEVLGIVSVAAADWIDLGGTAVATIRNIGLLVEAGAASTSIYLAAITRGTPTHTASGITLKLGLLRD